MKNRSLMVRHALTVAATLAMFLVEVSGVVAQCDPPDESPTAFCDQAPQTCLVDACFSTDNQQNPGHGGFCDGNPFDGMDSTGIQNPQYFVLEATDTIITIDLVLDNCTSGGLLQAAIIDIANTGGNCDSWTNGDVLDCDGGFTTSTFLEAFPVVIGNTYLFLIDGFSGATCQYTIANSTGILEPQLQGELDPSLTVVESPVCPGDDFWFAEVGPAVGGAFGYEWDGMPLPGGGTGIVTSTLTTLDNSTDGFAGIPEDAAPGIYTVTVTPFSGCDEGDVPITFQFEIVAVPDSTAPDSILCVEEFTAGIPWLGLNITSPGTYTTEIDNPRGCPFDVTKTFNQYPVVIPGMIDTLVCGLDMMYEGVTYDVAGSYQLDYPGAAITGCDSTAFLNVDFAYVEAFPDFTCDVGGDFVIQSFTQALVPNNIVPMFIWRDELGDVVSNDADWVTQTPGTYELEIIIEVNGFQCSYSGFNPVQIILADIVPDRPVLLNADSTICAAEIPLFEIVPDQNGEIVDYSWSGPSDAVEVGGNGTTSIAYDWSNSPGGQVCVTWTNNCGESEPTCFEVVVNPQASPSFTISEDTACVDEVVTITYDGIASGQAEFVWNFDGGTIVTGGTNDRGPHEIFWNTTGTQTVSVQVTEPGCDTSEYTQNITIENLEAPVLNCSSTTSSVTVSWNQVPGAVSYDVNILSPNGLTGVQVDPTTFEVTGLASGTSVEIEVLAIGNGACPPRPDTIICSADDCPAPTWSITPGDTTVCENSGSFNYSAVINGSAATGTWSGPGIVDPATGLFDPSNAGSGQHTIRFDFNDGQCAFSFTREVEVIELATSSFTVTTPICELDVSTITYTGTGTPGATYQWDFDGGQIISGANEGPYDIQWSTPGAKNITLTVIENGCESAQSQETVQVEPAVGPINLNCSTTTTSVTISWDAVDNAASYSVVPIQGPAGTRNGLSYEVTGLVPGNVVEVEVIAASTGLCPERRDTILCIAQDCPSPQIDISPLDSSLCLVAGLVPFDMSVTVTGGTGTGEWSGPGITDVNAGTFDPYTAGPGDHQIVYTYNDQSCTFTEQAIIRVYDVPDVVIDAPELQLTCENGNQVVLDGAGSIVPSGQVAYLWSTSDGNILSPADSSAAIAGAAGTYVLLITDQNSGCTDIDSVVVTQDANLPVADAGPDRTLNCDLRSVELGGNSTSGPGITYLWTTPDGNILSDPTRDSITVDAPGTYNLLLTDTANGCEARGSVQVFEDVSVPMPMLDVDGVLTCDNQNVRVTSDVMGGNGQFIYSWTTTDGTIEGADDSDAITAISPGMYKLVVEDEINGCIDSAEIEVMADSDIIASLDVNQRDPSCFGETDGSIVIDNVNGGSTPYTYAWTDGSDGTSITGLSGGNYGVTVTDANGCSFSQSFDLREPVLLTADIGADLQVNKDDSVRIDLVVSVDPGAIRSITWSGPVPPCDGCFSNQFIAETSGTVGVEVVDTNGCVANAQLNLRVSVDRTVFMPNVFTPNGDNANDFLNVFGPSIRTVDMFRIYDRWGNLLWETTELVPNNTEVGWDGTMDGEEMQPGVYVFYAKVTHDDDFEEELIGDVTLLR